MSGWIALGLLAAAGFGLMLWPGRLPRKLWQAAMAAILLGMTGYVLQGRPSLPSSPAKPIGAKNQAADAMILMRSEMDRTFGAAKRYNFAADSFSRQGDYSLSAAFIRSGLTKYPQDGDLWSALGLQLMLASDGKMSAAAQLAFDKARSFEPKHPAPDYFEGLNALFAGDVATAKARWQHALDNGTPKAKWRPRLELQLRALTELEARGAAGSQSDEISP